MGERDRRRATSDPDLEPESGVARVLVATAVREAIDAFSSPTLASQIIEAALARSMLTSIPRDSEPLARWIHVSLVDVARAELGLDAAAAIADRLAPLVESLARIETDEAASGRALRDSGEIHLEVLARRNVIALAIPLGDRGPLIAALAGASLRWADDEAAMGDLLHALHGEPRVVLVECRAPGNLFLALASSPPALLDDAVIVLWGAGRIETAHVMRTFPNALVRPFAKRTTAAELGMLLAGA